MTMGSLSLYDLYKASGGPLPAKIVVQAMQEVEVKLRTTTTLFPNYTYKLRPAQVVEGHYIELEVEA